MSDLCMYELEDIAWDEYDLIDDHIVPHPGHEHGSKALFQQDSCKKPRHEVIGVSSNVSNCFTAKFISQGDEGLQPLKRKRTKSLGRNSWPQSAEGVLPVSHDSVSIGEPTELASDSTRVPGHCIHSVDIDIMGTESANDAIADVRCAANESNSCPHSLNDISQIENDLSFLDNDREDNESSDLLYYGWPNIEDFEDVDRMFRSCDSTFGFGSSNDNDLGWLSSSHTIGESEDMLKSDFKVSCPELSSFKSIPEHDQFEQKNASSPVIDSKIGSAYISKKSGFQALETGEADPSDSMSFMNGSAISNGKGGLTPIEKGIDFKGVVCFNNSTTNQTKKENGRMKEVGHLNLSEGKRKDQYKSLQVFADPELQKQKKKTAAYNFTYVQTPTPYVHLNYVRPSDHISVGSKRSGLKSETNSLIPTSPKESSYASNQAHSIESSYYPPSGAPAMSVLKKREKLQRQHGLHPSLIPKQVHSQNEAENHCGVESVNTVNPTDRDSLKLPESSCVSSGGDEVSVEASSFRQLQQVMEKLDVRTKLCIKDSLYRLARSAEQRHQYTNMNGGGLRNEKSSHAFLAEGPDNGFMDIETDTNPIDRTVAHLLFHRPSDPSVTPAHDGSSTESRVMVHGSINNPIATEEQLVCPEEAASDADKKVSDH